jgi:hypothetical protein
MLAIMTAFGISGCAVTSDYMRYAEMQTRIHKAQADADIAKANAIKELGASGGDAAKVAAVMALMIPGAGQSRPQIDAPRSTADEIRDWFAILVPSIVQGYGIRANQRIAITQSNNSRDVAISTNGAFVGIASQIQAPGDNVTTTNTTTTNTTTTDNHAISGSYNPIDNHSQNNPSDNHSQSCTTGPC